MEFGEKCRKKCFDAYLVEKELLPLIGSSQSVFTGYCADDVAEKLKWNDKKYR